MLESQLEQQDKRKKYRNINKKKVYVSLGADGMVICLRNSKDFPKTKQTYEKTLSVHKFRKEPAFKINTQKSSAFQYTNEKHTEKETRRKTHSQQSQKAKIPVNQLN